MVDTMMRVAMYLRKSRADLELEAKGEGETLTKHKKSLLAFAKKNNLNVTRFFLEVVSGESILFRPEMQELLKCVESKEFDAVLVMDIDRLGRGNMQEQGLILSTFRDTNTKIITPTKTYDLLDESDELMTEVQTLFARQELKMINRRLQRGRVQSVEAGNYIGTKPPYGWLIQKEGKSRWLYPHPEQFKVMELIFEWYTNDDPEQRKAANMIANALNDIGHKSYTGGIWKGSSVLTVLKNKANAGYVENGKKKYKKTITGREVKTQKEGTYTSVVGKHMKYISDKQKENFKKAQEILKDKWHVPYQLENGIKNSMAGLIRCGKCGYAMSLRPYYDQPPHLICITKECDCRSSQYQYVEKALITGLEQWVSAYKVELSKHKKQRSNENEIEVKKMAVISLTKEIEDLEKQKGRLHDFLEREIYTEDVYLERSKNLALRMDESRQALANAERSLQEEIARKKAEVNVIPLIQNVIKTYYRTNDPARRNALLKSILQKIEYRKEPHQRKDDFEIKLYPKI